MNSDPGQTFVIAQATDGKETTAEELIKSESTEISEAIGVSEPQSGGMPQFDFSNYAPQIVWLAITFVALYVLMSKVALPRIATVIEHRRDRIASDLDAAARLKEETDEVIAAYEAELAEARGRAHEIAAETRDKLNSELAEERAEVEAGLAKKTAQAEKRIADTKAKAMAEVDSAAADAAAEIVTALTGLKPTKAEIDKAVVSALPT
ncbi:F0F1 ATP synthase subunit B [Microbaculum marinisediminis]|uniref:ATP synthase subunit b n=1 Tax=Microbaculum marinisediminis TaxID=2931392 RepID=A0AAW5QQG6_9HYPH|nr:F0F1 ATP synthase subunit B [Microbaculum sp. A6E488]MCT8970326.1 F0F1 ATP synthase subunit B [Microbaculum sp. A6E488]